MVLGFWKKLAKGKISGKADEKEMCRQALVKFQELMVKEKELAELIKNLQIKSREKSWYKKLITSMLHQAKIKRQEIKNLLAEFQEMLFADLIKCEKKKLEKFFGQKIEVSAPPREITKKRLKKWKQQGFELHYLPDAIMSADKDYPGWKYKPFSLFDYVREREIANIPEGMNEKTLTLSAGWILIDGRKMPDLDEDSPMYENDILGDVIAKLRTENMIEPYGNTKSRYNITWEELNKNETKEVFALVLGVDSQQIDLPRAIEWNVIGNLHHQQWGKTQCQEWFKEVHIAGGPFCGGYISSGGISGIYWENGHGIWNTGFRLIVHFPE